MLSQEMSLEFMVWIIEEFFMDPGVYFAVPVANGTNFTTAQQICYNAELEPTIILSDSQHQKVHIARVHGYF